MTSALFASLSQDETRTLLSMARRRRFARGEVLFHEGDPGDSVHIIDKGHVAMRITTPLGDTATLLVAGPGDLFGELAVLSGDTARNSTVIALDAVETLSLHRDRLDDLRREHREVDQFLLTVLASEVRRLSARLLEALYVPADKRIYRRLSDLAELFVDDDESVIPVTQEDLASMAGTTRPTVNRIVKAAEEAGLVRVSRGRIEVLDSDGIARRGR